MSAEKQPSMVHLKIDGQTIYVPAGTTILEAAWNRKIDIPVLCHEQDRTPVGVCRMCVVDVHGRAYAAACMLKAEVNEFKRNPSDPDLVVETNTKEVQDARNTMLQLLMAEHPQSCVTSEHRTQCELETLVARLGVPETPYGRLSCGSRGQDKSSHSIQVNHDACILCDRCIRACADEGHYVIARQGKGHEARIAFGLGKPMYSSGCVSCGACVIACPTGAITNNFHSPAFTQPIAHSDADFAFGKTNGVEAARPLSAQSKELLQRGSHCGISDLLKHESFQRVSRKFLEQNAGCLVRRRIRKGEILFKEGEAGHSAFLIEEGSVDIFMRPRKPEKVRKEDIGPWGRHERTLGPGELTGEMSCLNCYPRSATAIAATDCVVLEMLRNILEMLRDYKFRDQLEMQYRQRALDVLVDNDELFAPLTRSFADLLHENARLVRYGPNEVIFEEGQPADAFYLVSLGFVKVSRKSRTGPFVLSYLGPGSHFGELSLLTNKQHHATCTALHHVEAIRIDGPYFQEMMERFPGIRDHLQSEVGRYTSENQEQWLRIDDPVVEQAETGLEEAESMLVLDLDKCTRCDQCVIACAETHNGTTRLIRDGLRVDHYLVASACRHCHDPLCMVCHWDAITRDYTDKSRAVIIHQDKCVGCGQCAVHCPYGNIKLIDEKGKLVPFELLEDGSKRLDLQAKANSCDLCPDYTVPSCVHACPHDAAHRYSAAKFRSVRNQGPSRRRN